MKLLTSIILFTFTATAKAADPLLLRQIQDFRGMFDGTTNGSIRGGGEGFMPSLPKPKIDGGLPWGEARREFDGVPGIKSAGAVRMNRAGVKDPFQGREECQVLNLVYARQPSTEEAASALAPCLASISKEYGVSVSAVAGEKTLNLVVAGRPGQDTAAGQDITHALTLRGGTLFGWPVKIERSARGPVVSSSLQFVVDRCPDLDPAVSKRELFDALRECLTRAKNLSITDIAADPSTPGALIVYTKADSGALSDMNGVMRLPGGTFTIRAMREIVPEQNARVQINERAS